MKKLMFAVALAGAMTGVCDVTSSNCVGYLGKEAINANSTTWMINTFEKVDGTVVKLKDFSVKEVLGQTAIHVKLREPSGKIAEVAFGDQGKTIKQYFNYVHPENPQVAGQGWKPGWYYATKEDGKTAVSAVEWKKGDTSAYWAGEVEIPYGTGFGFERAGNLATLMFSGQVKGSDAQLEAVNANSTTWLGNCMPVDMTLKEITIKESLGQTAIHLKLLEPSGKIKEVAFGDQGKTIKQYFNYVHPENPQVAGQGWKPGWYYATKEDGKTAVGAVEWKKGDTSAYWAGEVEIKAGDLFGFERASNLATVVVPSPLVDHSAK